jgi:hypothetical protein
VVDCYIDNPQHKSYWAADNLDCQCTLVHMCTWPVAYRFVYRLWWSHIDRQQCLNTVHSPLYRSDSHKSPRNSHIRYSLHYSIHSVEWPVSFGSIFELEQERDSRCYTIESMFHAIQFDREWPTDAEWCPTKRRRWMKQCDRPKRVMVYLHCNKNNGHAHDRRFVLDCSRLEWRKARPCHAFNTTNTADKDIDQFDHWKVFDFFVFRYYLV